MSVTSKAECDAGDRNCVHRTIKSSHLPSELQFKLKRKKKQVTDLTDGVHLVIDECIALCLCALILTCLLANTVVNSMSIENQQVCQRNG